MRWFYLDPEEKKTGHLSINKKNKKLCTYFAVLYKQKKEAFPIDIPDECTEERKKKKKLKRPFQRHAPWLFIIHYIYRKTTASMRTIREKKWRNSREIISLCWLLIPEPSKFGPLHIHVMYVLYFEKLRERSTICLSRQGKIPVVCSLLCVCTSSLRIHRFKDQGRVEITMHVLVVLYDPPMYQYPKF